ncbi:aminotransferase class V-fold PLP-dependent enzyme [Paracoccus sp. (in: a-proteobacteria)]|uniref:aminotransferase class V-fold PLP-dependent enzyme n=1 Tax=Paracoccus sp. TaxID=267 RepID=UPI003A86E0AF
MTKAIRGHDGYFLYHGIGMYPGKEADLARASAVFARHWSAPDDGQWGFLLGRRQGFIDRWRALLNAPEGTVTTTDTVTEGVHRVMRALPEGRLRDKRVLIAADCFPSVHFLLAGLAPKMGFTLDTVPLSQGCNWVATGDFIDRWGRDVGLAMLTWISSTASSRVDLTALARHGREMGSLIGVDVTQGIGLFRFDARDPGVDFVVGSSLKWLCGTPGAGALHVDQALIPELRHEGRGWFSQDNPFSWDLDKFAYAPDIRRLDGGTPGAVAALSSLPALDWHAGQDADALTAWNGKLTAQIVARADAAGLPLQSPRDPAARGGSVMLRLPDAAAASATVEALGREGIWVDARGPVLRMSPGNMTRPEAIDALFDLINLIRG